MGISELTALELGKEIKEKRISVRGTGISGTDS